MGLSLDYAINKIKEKLDSMIASKEEIKKEEIEQILNDYTELAMLINGLEKQNERYERTMIKIDDYIDLIRDEVIYCS